MKFSKYIRLRKCHSTTSIVLPNFQYISLNEYNLTKWMERRGFSTPDIVFFDIKRKQKDWASTNQLNYVDTDIKNQNDSEYEHDFESDDFDTEDQNDSEKQISEKRIIDLFRDNHPVVIFVDDEEENIYTNNWFNDWVNCIINCLKQCSGIVDEQKPKKINRNYSTGSNQIELQEIKKSNK